MTTRVSYLPFAALIAFTSMPATAQVRDSAPAEDTPPVVLDPRPARTSDADRAGQRQTRENTARETGIEPMARINNRVANRVQSRLRNRIDRTYDPRANATSPFAVAEEQTRSPRR